jgi:nucleotide-binding universal stress UspA family protein
MRILIAYDGSPGAQQAAALAGSLAWPQGSALRVAGAVEFARPFYTGLRHDAMASPETDPLLDEGRRAQVADVVAELSGTGHDVDGIVLRGRTATVLVEHAASFAADLVITGSRGHGTVTSLLLGSVSAELVETAPCPVLVARTPEARTIVVAVDGSAAADQAVSLLETWPITPGGSIHVVSVAEVIDPIEFGLAPARYHAAAAHHAGVVAEQKQYHAQLAEDTAARLRAVGRPAQAMMRTGRAASEVLAVASETHADLIVMGSRGRTGLARMVLGSVARKVVNDSAASALIVRAR